MKHDVHILNAFSLHGRGGNPAGVVVADQEIEVGDRQKIAQKVGLSETAFVQLDSSQSVSLQFHTPNREIAYCGHATLAALHLLQRQGHLREGQVQLKTSGASGVARINDKDIFMSQTAPAFEPVQQPGSFIQSIGLPAEALAGDLEIVSTGNRFLVIPIKDGSSLKALRPDHDQIARLSNQFNLIGYYAYVGSHREPKRAYVRMFAPAYGIAEEAATGMAAGVLAGHLDRQNPEANGPYEFYQGHLMASPSPSRLVVTLDKDQDQVARVWVGGQSRYVSTQALDI